MQTLNKNVRLYMYTCTPSEKYARKIPFLFKKKLKFLNKNIRIEICTYYRYRSLTVYCIKMNTIDFFAPYDANKTLQ